MQIQSDQINVRIDSATKQAAEAVFSQLGLSATDAIRMFYRQVSMCQGLPFEAKLQEPAVKGAKKSRAKIHEAIKQSVEKNRAALIDLAGR